MQYLSKTEFKELTDHQKIFGDIEKPMATHIVTLAKYVIYDSRREEARPSLSHFILRLSQDFETERYIMRNSPDRFNEKWRGLFDLT